MSSLNETFVQRIKRQWHELLEALAHQDSPLNPPLRQHRPSASEIERSLRRIGDAVRADANGKTTLPDLTKARELAETAGTRELATEWLKALPQACTAASIRKGNLRLRDDVPKHVTEHFVKLSKRIDEALMDRMTRAAASVFNAPTEKADAAIDGAVSEVSRAINNSERGISDTIVIGPSERSNFSPRRVDRPDPRVIRHVVYVDEPDGEPTPDGEIMAKHSHVTVERHTNAIRRPNGATNVGTEPVHWDRYSEDMQVFASKRPGGTVLIDGSGSMSWDYDKLRAGLKGMPAATVAIYSGGGGRGRLCIIAQRGRWSDVEPDEMMGGNEVDIEGLEWLANQKGPRVWLSDGMVTGGQVGRLGRDAAYARIDSLCKSADIMRANSMDDAIASLKHPGRKIEGTFAAGDAGFLPGDSHFGVSGGFIL